MRVKPKPEKKQPEVQSTVVRISSLEAESWANKLNAALVKELTASVGVVGVETPINVRRKKDDDHYYIIDGGHRAEAARQAGLEMVPVINHGYISDVDAKTIAYRKNLLRRKPTKKEQIDTCRFFEKEGLKVTEIAERLCLAKSTVSEYLTLAKASPKLRAAAEKKTGEGGVSNKTALRVARMPKEEQEKVTRRVVGKTEKQAEVVLGPPKPKIITDPTKAPVPTQSMGVLMPGETLSKKYRLVSDWRERCQRIEIEVGKRIKQTPSNQRLQGMELVIGVLRGKLTVEQAFVNWQKV